MSLSLALWKKLGGKDSLVSSPWLLTKATVEKGLEKSGAYRNAYHSLAPVREDIPQPSGVFSRELSFGGLWPSKGESSLEKGG